MSLTRKLLESLGIESDKVTTIIEAHAETVDALKAQIGDLKSNADKYETTKADLDKVKAELDTLKGSDWQKKYEKEHAEFEAFKTEQSAKESKSAKESAYRELLSNAGVSEKRIGSILKVTDLDKLELVDGKIKDSDKLTESVKPNGQTLLPQKTPRALKPRSLRRTITQVTLPTMTSRRCHEKKSTKIGIALRLP